MYLEPVAVDRLSSLVFKITSVLILNFQSENSFCKVEILLQTQFFRELFLGFVELESDEVCKTGPNCVSLLDDQTLQTFQLPMLYLYILLHQKTTICNYDLEGRLSFSCKITSFSQITRFV
jgi:hypothetical protein